MTLETVLIQHFCIKLARILLSSLILIKLHQPINLPLQMTDKTRLIMTLNTPDIIMTTRTP